MCVPTWESVIYDVRISNVLFMRVNVFTANTILNLCIMCILIKNRACKFYVCVSPLKWAYFWSSVFWVQIRYGSSSCSTFVPTRTWFSCRMIVVQICDKVSGS